MKRGALILIVIAAMFGGATTGTASADSPLEVVDSFVPTTPQGTPVTFTSPCSGEAVTITLITRTAQLHQHSNTFIGNGKQTGTTDLGHVMSGRAHVTINKNNLSDGFTDDWSHPVTGERFKVHGNLKLDLSNGPPELRIDIFSTTCIKA